jgi:hypothetical protein
MTIRKAIQKAKKHNIYKSGIRRLMKYYHIPGGTMSVGQIYNVQISVDEGDTWETVSCGDYELMYKPKKVSISTTC